MSARERRKGASGELEVVHLLQAAGWLGAKRTSDGREQLLRGDIAGGPKSTYIEVRRRETASVWAWHEEASRQAQPGHVPLVFFRRSRSPWLALVSVDELLPLLALREREG